MDQLVAIIIALILGGVGSAFVLQGLKLVKFAKGVKPTAALIIGAGALIVLAFMWTSNYGGFSSALSSVGGVPAGPGGPSAPLSSGVTITVDGSESDTNLTYDYGSKTFTCSFVENTTGDNIGATASPYNSINTVTLTLTVYNETLGAATTDENDVLKISIGTIPTYYGKGENASTLYWPIDRDDTTQKYEVDFLPAGGAHRDEMNTFSVGAGGSKAITVTADTYHMGLSQLDNNQSKEIPIYIESADGILSTFTLRYTKTSEVV